MGDQSKIFGTTDGTDTKGPWALASGPSYDPAKFFMKATDSKGHSHNIQAPLHTGVHAIISQLVGDKRTPYRSVQDFVRDAVVHRLRWWMEVESEGVWSDIPGQTEMFQMEVQRQAMANRKQRIEDAEAVMGQAEEQFRAAVSRGQWVVAEEIASNMEHLLVHWGDLPNYRELDQACEAMFRQITDARKFGQASRRNND